uniref:Uncharacterized protein n=3 Tax=Neisseria meningitidis TaxID=487 RepID=C6SI29_NEIME|nr:hypothetical protein predicted by Glimmer/Critica [Neisseria meningitidis alpha275]CBA06130.1 hypothetical protein predicted by Glimmer/Critica [Neisseria meningitidis alpha153]CCA44988.1 hypothetical protein NMALPHA522_1447 [Neisseria meningitidis alpha522]
MYPVVDKWLSILTDKGKSVLMKKCAMLSAKGGAA